MKIFILVIFTILSIQIFSVETPKKISLPNDAIERNSFDARTDVNDPNPKNDEVLIRFVTENPSDPYKIGDDILYFNTDNNTTYKGKLLKQSKEFINEGEYGKKAGGIGLVLNLPPSYKKNIHPKLIHRDFKHYVAFFRFNEDKFKFCDIQRDYKDESLKPLIEKYKSPNIKKDNQTYSSVSSINFDDKSLILVITSFDVKGETESDSHQNETLIFEKEKNGYKFLQRVPVSEDVRLCIKEKDSPTWKFLIEDRETYSGDTSWAEFKNNQFKSYYEVEGWSD